MPFPQTYLVTPEPEVDASVADFIISLDRSLEAGVRLVQLRAKTLSVDDYAALAVEALSCCRRHGARLLLNTAPDVAQRLGADGVHLTSTRLMACETRPLSPSMLVSAACHDDAQVLHANRIGVDLLTISPVLPTATHTTAQPLGWQRLRELVLVGQIPVYALGGMSKDTLPEARAAGAVGIAAIRSVWKATP